ncbi:MAG: HAMP domain-containing sensor histidine kinase [Mariniphaga sp.]
MLNQIFPIKPTFLTRFKDFDGQEDIDEIVGSTVKQNYDLNLRGVFSQDLIHGFLTVLSHEKIVKAPITLYEFVKNDLINGFLKNEIDEKEASGKIRILKPQNDILKSILGDRQIVRTDNETHYSLKNSCTCFRGFLKNDSDKKGIRLCDELDSRSAFMAIKNLTESNFEQEISKHIGPFNEFLSIDKIILVKKSLNIQRPFIYYKCPYSFFYEIIFPIFHEKRVIGCIMVGEVYANDTDKKEISSNIIFHLNQTGIQFSDNEKKIFRKNADEDIKNELEPYKILDFRKFSPIDINIPLLNIINEKIINFERRLNQRVNLFRQLYISEKFQKIKLEFQFDTHKNTLSDGKLNVNILASKIENSLKSIVDQFPNEGCFIRIFMPDTGGDDKKLKIMAASDRDKSNSDYFNDFIFDFKDVKKVILEFGKDISNIDKNTGLDSEILGSLKFGIKYKGLIPENFVETPDIIRYYPTLASDVFFVIWERFTDDFLKNRESFNLFQNAMFDFYTVIAANYAALWGSQIKSNLEDSFRIASHESNQIIPRIKSVIKHNLESTPKLIQLVTSGIVQKKIDDLNNSIDLLKFFVERPAYQFRKEDLKIEPVDVHEIFFKLIDLYILQLKHKGIWIDVFREKSDRIYISADKNLFEHIMHNLVDNAIKYCYRGTKIKVFINDKDKSYVLHVLSYGPPIIDKKKIFDLYHREQTEIQGLGIGMYLVKKAVESHDWTITVESKEIHCYNIPYIAYYYSKLKLNKSEELLSKCDDTKKSILANIKNFHVNDFSELLNYYSKENAKVNNIENEFVYEPLPTTFKEEFEKSTYRNDFIISIKK